MLPKIRLMIKASIVHATDDTMKTRVAPPSGWETVVECVLIPAAIIAAAWWCELLSLRWAVLAVAVFVVVLVVFLVDHRWTVPLMMLVYGIGMPLSVVWIGGVRTPLNVGIVMVSFVGLTVTCGAYCAMLLSRWKARIDQPSD